MRARAAEIAAETGAYQTDQFNNTDMVEGYLALGAELLEQLDGRLDASPSTSGPPAASSASTRALRERLPAIHRVAVEPAESAVLSGAPARDPPDRGWRRRLRARRSSRSTRSTRSSRSRPPTRIAMARRAARDEGVWSGPSTGANLTAALAVARRLGEGARVATIQVDSGLKYLAGELYT